MGNEKKPKKKKRLSEAGVIIIGALVGLPLTIGLLYGIGWFLFEFLWPM